jgi:hypothetical protein
MKHLLSIAAMAAMLCSSASAFSGPYYHHHYRHDYYKPHRVSCYYSYTAHGHRVYTCRY